jgi:hypothetical protein
LKFCSREFWGHPIGLLVYLFFVPAQHIKSLAINYLDRALWIGADIIELDDPACLIIIKSDRF